MKNYYRVHQLCYRPRPHTNQYHVWARDPSDAVRRAKSMTTERHEDDVWRGYYLRSAPEQRSEVQDYTEL